MKKILLSLLALGISIYSIAQHTFENKSSSEILHELKKLQSNGTVMYLAAHPDDENTRLISYLVHERNVRTVYYSLTRGDGGQNIIGNEQGKYLGLIRTLEMNEARRLDGAEQIYSSAIDFGFSKNPEEVLSKWNKDQLLKEIKQAYQHYKPDVVILRFPTTGEGGHGQHTASAILAVEAYQQLQEEAKSNPNIFVPKRILFNAFNFGDRSTQKEDQLKIPINQYNALLGKTYGQLAGQSRSMHKSQGAGTPQAVGIHLEYFQHLAGEEATTDLFDGIDLSWKAGNSKSIQKMIDQVIKQFNPDQPELAIPALMKIKKQLSLIKGDTNTREKLAHIDQLILACSGIQAELLTEKAAYTKAEPMNSTLNIISRYPNVVLKAIVSDEKSENDQQKITIINHTFKPDYKFSQKLQLQNVYDYSNPYWLGKNADPYHFEAIKHKSIGDPIQAPHHITAQILIENEPFEIKIPIAYKRLDPLRGDVMNAVRIEPKISIAPTSQLLFIDQNAKTTLNIKTNKAVENVNIGYKVGNQYSNALSLDVLRNGLDTMIHLDIKADLTSYNSTDIQYFATVGKDTFTQHQKVLTYEHIPETQYLQDATQKIVIKDWKSTIKRIGYIQGVDDLVDDVLKALDFNVINLEKKDFLDEKYINQFEAIVVGIRAYNVNEDIAAIQPLLMNYVKNGGTVIIQYNTNNNLKIKDFGPYPFEISRNRITREDAPTTINQAHHRLLNYPNKIVASDWDQWVQERGLYYPTKWDNKYQTLITHQEFDEPNLESGILYTTFGRGHYIYTPLAFFRQLPAGNTGAIKLFMNFLSVGK